MNKSGIRKAGPKDQKQIVEKRTGRAAPQHVRHFWFAASHFCIGEHWNMVLDGPWVVLKEHTHPIGADSCQTHSSCEPSSPSHLSTASPVGYASSSTLLKRTVFTVDYMAPLYQEVCAYECGTKISEFPTASSKRTFIYVLNILGCHTTPLDTIGTHTNISHLPQTILLCPGVDNEDVPHVLTCSTSTPHTFQTRTTTRQMMLDFSSSQEGRRRVNPCVAGIALAPSHTWHLAMPFAQHKSESWMNSEQDREESQKDHLLWWGIYPFGVGLWLFWDVLRLTQHSGSGEIYASDNVE